LGDKIAFQEAASAQAKVVVAKTSATTANSGLESYTVANGIITFTPVGLGSAASLSTQLADARYLVARANSGIDSVAAFVYGNDTYVISSGHIAATSVAEAVNVTKLSNVKLKNIGNAAADSSLVANVTISATGTSTSAVATVSADGVTTNTYTQTGYSGATHTTTGSADAVTTTVTKDVGLSSYAEVTIGNSTSGTDYHSGSFEFAQNGAAGSNYLKVVAGKSSYDATQIIDKITVNENWAVEFNTAGLASGATLTVTNLVDATNTLSTVYLTGGEAAYLDQITSTSLKTIDASTASGAVNVGRAVGTVNGPITNNGITLKASTAATTAYLSGASDVVTLNSTTTAGVGGGSFYLSGASVTVSAAAAGTLQDNLTIYASGTDANIDLSKTTTDSSKVVTIYGATSSAGVGTNAVVKLGTGIASNVQTVFAGANTTVSLANYNTVDVTKATAAYGTAGNMTTIQHGTNTSGTTLTAWSNDKIAFNSVATIANVNVSAATSLASALSTADAVAEGSGSSATQHALVWFQYGGDTYIVQSENTGDQTSGVDTTDIVVKVVGINDVTSVSSGVVTIA
jgi:hypothetical protein